MNRWRVFAQDPEPVVQAAAWQRAAERFFGAKLEIAGASRDSCVITLDGGARHVSRHVFGRARDETDLRDALAADTRAGFTGLYDLAERRCSTIWLVEREGAADRAALQIAAVLATVCLGPILGDETLFGVRTARDKLAAL